MNSKVKALQALGLTALLCTAEAPAGEWSGTATVASQYVSRGFQQSWGRPVMQAGVQHDWTNGIYAGSWASGVSDRFIEGARVEWDLYVGYSTTVDDVTFGATLYQYRYPGARVSAVDQAYDYGELVLSANWRMLTVSYAHTWSEDYFGYNSRTLGIGEGLHSRGSGYLDLSADIPLADATHLKLHVGRQHVRNFAMYDWTDARIGIDHDLSSSWRMGASYARGWNSAGLFDAYTTGVPDADGTVHVGTPLDGAWALTLTHSF